MGTTLREPETPREQAIASNCKRLNPEKSKIEYINGRRVEPDACPCEHPNQCYFGTMTELERAQVCRARAYQRKIERDREKYGR